MIPLGDVGETLLREGRASVLELARISGVDPLTLKGVVRELRGIRLDSDDAVVVDRLELVLSLMEKGVDPGRLSKYLSWREFEAHASRVLREAGFNVVADVRLSSPRRLQVDVLGYRQGVALVIDCKHWSPRISSPSRLREAAAEHVIRTRRLVSTARFWTIVTGGLSASLWEGDWKVYPLLVILRASLKGPLEGATIVPVSMLPGFLKDFDLYRFDLPHIRASPPRS